MDKNAIEVVCGGDGFFDEVLQAEVFIEEGFTSELKMKARLNSFKMLIFVSKCDRENHLS